MNKTPIEWTDFTSNPIKARRQLTPASKVNVGHYCEKISPGCSACYASRLQKRFGMPTFDARDPSIEPFLDEAELQKLLKRRKPCKVFLGDMTDIFGYWVPDEWLDKIFAVMALTPHVTYQVLTKRSKRMREYWSTPERVYRIGVGAENLFHSRNLLGVLSKQDRLRIRDLSSRCWGYREDGESVEKMRLPLPNVHLGVSAENQQYADERIPDLLQTPAAVRFVSYEPALGPVDFSGLNAHYPERPVLLDLAPWSLRHEKRMCRVREWRTDGSPEVSSRDDYP